MLEFVTTNEHGLSYVDRYGLEATIERFECMIPHLHGLDWVQADVAHYTARPLVSVRPPRLYRGARSDRARGLSWTTDLLRAVLFVDERGGNLWTADFTADDVLAVIRIDDKNGPASDEWIMRPPADPQPIACPLIGYITEEQLVATPHLTRTASWR